MDEGLALAGTFQEALHNQITDALAGMFAVILAHMDRNGGLSLFKDMLLSIPFLKRTELVVVEALLGLSLVPNPRFTLTANASEQLCTAWAGQPPVPHGQHEPVER